MDLKCFESKVCSGGKFLEINSLENFQWMAFDKISWQQWAMGDFEQKKIGRKTLKNGSEMFWM